MPVVGWTSFSMTSARLVPGRLARLSQVACSKEAPRPSTLCRYRAEECRRGDDYPRNKHEVESHSYVGAYGAQGS